MIRDSVTAVLAFVFFGAVGGFEPALASVYNLHLSTDNGPDYTDIDSFVRTATEGCTTPQEKCIAIWRWGRRSRRQTSCANDHGRLIWDPILHYNSYGTMNCGVISGLNIACWLKLGYLARYIQLGDHTVSEVSWDDGKTWHLFDSSMSFFCYNHAGEVASCAEIKAAHACELSGGKSAPGHFYLYHGAPQCVSHLGPDGWRRAADQPVGYDRTLINGASSYTNGFSVSEYTQYGRFGRRYVLNLRPYESYTRWWRPLDRGRTDLSDEARRDYYRPLGGRDPDDQHGLHNIRGNGRWEFAPDLANPACRTLFYAQHNIALSAADGAGPHLHPQQPGRTAAVTFKVSAANVITSMRIELDGVRKSAADTLRILVSPSAGIRWTPVWDAKQTGRQRSVLELRDEVAGGTECLVKVELLAAEQGTDVGLDRLTLTTTTQLNRRTLPKLTLGTNHVRLSADEQAETTVIWPVLHAGRYRQTVFREEDVFSAAKADGIYKATIGSAVNGRECFATWRLAVPTDISKITYGVVATNRSSASYVALRHCCDGDEFDEFYRKSTGGFPFDEQVVQTIAGDDIPAGARQAYLQCAFFCRGGAGTYGMDGIQDVWIRVQHKPRDERFEPFEVTYYWTEHRKSGDVRRAHTQRVTSLPHEYVINTAGFRDPTMDRVTMRLCGYARDVQRQRLGYSDGEDVGTRCEPPKLVYHWGTNLARNRPYTISRPSAAESGNGDQDGCELTNGVIVAPTDLTTDRRIQGATALWDSGQPVAVVVDLGGGRTLAGVRVSTHQPNARFCHPQRVEVAVSSDATAWQAVGTIQHDDLWKPPADDEPWEHDDDPRYDALPAGGRLAYCYPLVFAHPVAGRYVRLTFVPRNDCGMGLSEVQVFERAVVGSTAK
jgi:hypothetical protein